LRGQRLDLGVGGGRKRFNILGAYCPADGDYIDVRQAGGTISYTHVIALLEKIHHKHPGEDIVLHLDNARYQHARKLKEWIAQQHHDGVTFILAHIPPYSPNLNLIERLWKFVRKHALRTWHDTFEAMQQAIANVLDNLADYADELRTLMTEKFHIRPAA
jgi:transposase